MTKIFLAFRDNYLAAILTGMMILSGIGIQAQTRPYQFYPSFGGTWNRIASDSTQHIPFGPVPSLNGGNPRPGALYYVITAIGDTSVYSWTGNRWKKEGGKILVNIPLYLNGDTITLNQSDGNNDGYVAADDWKRFDSAAKHWKDTLTTVNAITSYGNKLPYFKEFYFGPNMYGSYYNGSTLFPAFRISVSGQTVAIGGRGLAAQLKGGLATGTENTAIGEWSLYQLTTGSNMTAIGKNSGGLKTNETYGIYIGHHAQGVAGRSNELQIGSSNWIYGWNGKIALGHNNPLERLHVGGKVAIDTIPNSVSADSVLSVDDKVVTKIAVSDLLAGAAALPSVVAVSSSTTLSAPSAAYNIIEVDASGGAVTLTLPSMTAGKSFVIKKVDSSANAVNFTTDEGAQTIITQWAGAEVYRRSSSYAITRIF